MTYLFYMKKLPEYLGLGTPEDSISSCYNLRPKPPKKDIITYLVNVNKSLRYECQFVTAHPEEKDRKFILNYNLSDGTIKIIELPIQNSGIVGGKYLSSRRIPLPNTNPNKPDYYTPKDFYIGAIIQIYAKRFIITSADLYVYRYMQAHPELFTPESIDNVRMFHLKNGNLKDDLRAAIEEDHSRYLQGIADERKKIEESADDIKLPTIAMASVDRLPSPFISEDEIKKEYHAKIPECILPCNMDDTQETLIPADKGIVRFREPHEE
jgi:hypothetical protein